MQETDHQLRMSFSILLINKTSLAFPRFFRLNNEPYIVWPGVLDFLIFLSRPLFTDFMLTSVVQQKKTLILSGIIRPHDFIKNSPKFFLKLIVEYCVCTGSSITCDGLYNRKLRGTEPSCVSQRDTWQSGRAATTFFSVTEWCSGHKTGWKKTKYDAHLHS